MKALLLKEYNNLEYTDVPNPEYGADEVLVQVKACGICGSDVHGIDGSTGRRIPPIIMGHEASGIIREKGKNVKNWKVGDRVTFDSTIYPLNDWYTKNDQYNLSDKRVVLGVSCNEYSRNGAFAELISIPQHILFKLPDSVSFNQAAMVEPAAVALHALNLSKLVDNDVVAVIGVGIIGLLIIKLLKIKGCKRILAIDISEERLTLAKMFGAYITINSNNPDILQIILDHSDSRGVDLVFEAVGINETFNLAVDSSRKGGRIILVGNLESDVNFSLQKVVTHQLNIQGSCAICGEFTEVLDLIGKKKLNVDDLISLTAPLSDGLKWFQKLYRKEQGLLKVILNP